VVGVRRFGMLIMLLTVLMVFFVLMLNISFHRPVLESLTFALVFVVGLTPELLPIIVTVPLAQSGMELSKHKVIVKRLNVQRHLNSRPRHRQFFRTTAHKSWSDATAVVA
jgi:P-type Mg2+ transporter